LPHLHIVILRCPIILGMIFVGLLWKKLSTHYLLYDIGGYGGYIIIFDLYNVPFSADFIRCSGRLSKMIRWICTMLFTVEIDHYSLSFGVTSFLAKYNLAKPI
jgi:hypothetical protein